MHFLDITIIFIFLLFCLYSGLKEKNKASRSLEDYFLAGRSASGWSAGISMAATQFAADTPLLITGLVATRGVFSLWQMWIYALSFLFLGFVLSGSWHRAAVITDAELSEIRYSSKIAPLLRLFKAIYFGIIFNCTVLAWVFFAVGIIAEPFMLWDQWLPAGLYGSIKDLTSHFAITLTTSAGQADTILIKSTNNILSIISIITITAFYSMLGGLRSVIATDVFQFVIMIVGTLLYALIIIFNLGGLSKMHDRLFAQYANGGIDGITAEQMISFIPEHAFDISFPLLMVFALQWIIQLNSDGTGYLAQRVMACKSEKDAKIATICFSFVQILFRSLLWLPIAIGLLIIFPPDPGISSELIKAERESTFVRGIAELLPIGVKGLMITAMIAALASTVDTHLNWGSSYITNDIFKRFLFPIILKKEVKQKSLVWVARVSNVFVILIAFFIMTHLTSINHAWQTSLLLGAGMGTVLILRWLWWRINAWAELLVIILSLMLAPFLLNYVTEQAWRLLLMAMSTTLVVLIAVIIGGPEDRKHLEKFYLRCKPIGFWGPIAIAAGDNPQENSRKLYRAILATIVSAFCIFCFLVALGTLLLGSAPPSFFTNANHWVILLLSLGTVSIPIWWKLGIGK
ncbi:MAG: Na+:solute symporter [Proteobacteria bacterium]|nr:Na+:solute symporter [Pseudomonadota bacterium]